MKKRRIIIPLIILLCIFLLFSGVFSRLVGYVQQPISSFGTQIYRWVYFAVADPSVSFEEIEALVEQRDAYAIDQVEYERVVNENEELRALLGFAERTAHQYVTATIIARSPLEDTGHFVIDKGENEGMAVGQPVIIGEGVLVGKVSSITNENATVTSISHQDSATAVSILNENKTIGLIEGGGGSLLTMSYIPFDQEIETNDLVVTSGLEEHIPGGLLVGVVNAVNSDSQETFKEAVVESLTDTKRHSRVLVLQQTEL